MGGWVGGWVEGVVYDLPVEGQEEEEEEKVVGWVSGSFLTEGEMAEKLATHPPTLFLMKHVLHDWGDEACVTILRNVRQAMLLPSSSSSSSSSAPLPPRNSSSSSKACSTPTASIVQPPTFSNVSTPRWTLRCLP